jgi:hypothetical protein
MRKKTKYTTVALERDEHLTIQYESSMVEYFCFGYKNKKRHKILDGHYYKSELQEKLWIKN